jgi:hypothetical protein
MHQQMVSLVTALVLVLVAVQVLVKQTAQFLLVKRS